MIGRINSLIGGAVTGAVITHFAVQNLFNPSMPEPAFAAVLSNTIAASVVFWIVSIVFFDWVVQNTGKTMFSAMVIALSQILLVDFNYVLIGRREMMPALISVGVLLVAWAAVAVVYDKLSKAS
jgi:hypothetical protein